MVCFPRSVQSLLTDCTCTRLYCTGVYIIIAFFFTASAFSELSQFEERGPSCFPTVLGEVLSSLRSLFLWHLCSILFKDGCLHCWRCRSAPFSRGRGKTQPAAEDFQVPATRIWKDRCTEAVLPAPMVPALVVVALRRGRRLGILFHLRQGVPAATSGTRTAFWKKRLCRLALGTGKTLPASLPSTKVVAVMPMLS